MKLEQKMPPGEVKPPPPPARASPPEGRLGSRIWILAIALTAILVIAFLVGYLPRHRRMQEIQSVAKSYTHAIPVVSATKVQASPNVTELMLPGTITPITEAFIFARATGYVKRRYVDIGDSVSAGQLLAEIEAPDLDEQVRQAQATVEQAEKQLKQAQAILQFSESQLALASVTWVRYKYLVARGAISRQDADAAETNYHSAEATVRNSRQNVLAAQDAVYAAKANLGRLLALQSFEMVRAPFGGLITARNVDVGALISTTGASQGILTSSGLALPSSAAASTAANTSTPSNASNASSTSSSASTPNGSLSSAGGTTQSGEMFRMAQIGRLRILVNVPQTDTNQIQPGRAGEVDVREFPKRVFRGEVTRTARSLDLFSRTMLTEVQVANPNGILLPGMYAQVRFQLVAKNPPPLVPSDSLIFLANGLQVAVLVSPPAGTPAPAKPGALPIMQIRMRKVEVGRDYGAVTEVVNGLNVGEYIVANPNDATRDGAIVQPVLRLAPVAPPGS